MDKIKLGELNREELTRVDAQIQESVVTMLNTKCAGVPQMYEKLWSERKNAKRKLMAVRQHHDLFKAALGMYYFDETRLQGSEEMLFDDRYLCAEADIIATAMNATPFQCSVIMTMKKYVATLLENVFGPQAGVCMQGTCDAGKSAAAKLYTYVFCMSGENTERCIEEGIHGDDDEHDDCLDGRDELWRVKGWP